MLCEFVCVYIGCLRLLFAFYLRSKIDGEDGGGLGGSVGVVMVVMMSPLLLLPPEKILVAQRNTAIILTSECWTSEEDLGRGKINNSLF